MSVRGAEDAGKSGSDASERRAGSGQRVHFEALVAVGEAEGGGFEAESVDVSPDGMRLRTAYVPEVGEKLVCRFDGMGAEIVAEGEVIWRNEEARGGEFGLRFIGLRGAAAEAVRSMCASLGGDDGGDAPEEEALVPRGARVRLHIEGLGSPMKARVREAATREVEVGSNLEFLKVGRSLELEDVDQGSRREATIEHVKVDVDPATNVPQLVVALRYDAPLAEPSKRKDEPKRSFGARANAAPATRRAMMEEPAHEAAHRGEPAAADALDERAEMDGRGADDREAAATDVEGDEGDERAAPAMGMGAKAAIAGRKMAGKVGPALAGMGSRAKGAMTGMLALIQKKRAERASALRSQAPRRMTSPPPAGALKSEGRRLVREDGMEGEEEALPLRSNKRAALIGSMLGLVAVLAIFGLTRTSGRSTSATVVAASASASALPAAEPVAMASGTPTANVPLFGVTPLSTTEPVAANPTPSATASAAAAEAPPAGEPDDGDDEGKSAKGPALKEWGQGTVQHPVTLKIKMDGAIERITGAAGAMGFTISLPNRRSVSTATDFARKDKRLASVKVINTSNGAEVTVQFKDGVPPYLAKAKGDKLEIAIGREGHSKVAKAKKEGSGKKAGGAKKKKPKKGD